MPAARRRRAPALLAAVLGGLFAAAAAEAHVVYGQASLSALVGEADVVARARILAPRDLAVGEEGKRRPAVSAELLEVFKGNAEPGRLRFAQHGHGVALYESGEEVLLFLRALGRSRELAALAETTDLAWVSLQEHDDKLELEPRSRRDLLAAVRGYLALDALPAGERRNAALRELTRELLRAADERLAASALRDLVIHGDVLLTAASAPELELLIDDPAVAIGARLGVLTQLDRRGLVDGERRWARLLRDARGADLLAVVRAAGAHPSPAVRSELIRLLAADDAPIIAAAALSLGVRGDGEAVEPLARLLAAGEPGAAMAAVRALGAIGVPEAIAALEKTAADHPLEDVRGRARAEVRRLGREKAPRPRTSL